MFNKTFVSLILFILFFSGGCQKNEKLETSINIAETKTVIKRDNLVPNFSWSDADGKTTDFDSYRGTVTLVNFWATWCGPCKKELPDLISLSEEFASKNVKFIGISVDRGANIIEDVGAFSRQAGIPYQIVISNNELEEAFGNPRAVPTTFLIDKNGVIAETYIGTRTKEFFAQSITALLKQ